MKNIKLIIADMDGTLLDDNHQINKEFWEVFEKMKMKNIRFSVASGRQYYSLLNIFKKVKDDMIFIAENGSYVVYKGEEIFSDVMRRESVADVIEKVRNRAGVSITLCGKKTGYIDKADSDFLPIVEKYFDRLQTVENLLTVDDDILKISIYEYDGVKENTIEYFRDTESDYKVTASTDVWIDIANRTANKGEAVEFVQEKLGINAAQTAAFGDYLNDVEMMEKAEFSFAMKNAHPDVKKLSFSTVGSNNDNGVVEKIIEILDSK